MGVLVSCHQPSHRVSVPGTSAGTTVSNSEYSRFEVALVWRNWWVKAWSEGYVSAEGGTRYGDPSQELMSKRRQDGYQMTMTLSTFKITTCKSNTSYVIGCICISLLVSLLGTFKFFWVYIGSLRASRHLSEDMTAAVLHAPLRWLDTVPTGRILNRFIADFNVVDSSLANHLVLLVYSGLQLIGIIVAGAIVSPYLLLLAVPLLAICTMYARQYLAGARDVKRLGKFQ